MTGPRTVYSPSSVITPFAYRTLSTAASQWLTIPPPRQSRPWVTQCCAQKYIMRPLVSGIVLCLAFVKALSSHFITLWCDVNEKILLRAKIVVHFLLSDSRTKRLMMYWLLCSDMYWLTKVAWRFDWRIVVAEFCLKVC